MRHLADHACEEAQGKNFENFEEDGANLEGDHRHSSWEVDVDIHHKDSSDRDYGEGREDVADHTSE